MEKKKLLCGALLGCSALLLVGCGKATDDEGKETKKEVKTQTISCSSTEEEEGIGSYTLTFNFIYNKDKKVIESANYQTILSYSEDLAETYEDLDFCEDYEDDEGVLTSCDSKIGDNTITTTFDIDVDKMVEANEDEDEDEQFKKEFTPEEVKEWVESNQEDFTCTIK